MEKTKSLNECTSTETTESLRIESLKIAYEALKGKIFSSNHASILYSDLKDIFFLADCNAKFIFDQDMEFLKKNSLPKEAENDALRRKLDEINRRA